MRDNLVLASIPEETEEDPESMVKNFIQNQLELPADTVNNITFHCVHRLGGGRPDDHRPRPIVAKILRFLIVQISACRFSDGEKKRSGRNN